MARLEQFVRNGGVLVWCDPKQKWFDLDGKKMDEEQSVLFGFETLAPTRLTTAQFGERIGSL